MVRFKVRFISKPLASAHPSSILLNHPDHPQNRWLLVEFIPVPVGSAGNDNPRGGANLNSKQVWAALKDSVLYNFGDTGWGAIGLSLNGMSQLDTGPILF
jgi:hypothetical protein